MITTQESECSRQDGLMTMELPGTTCSRLKIISLNPRLKRHDLMKQLYISHRCWSGHHKTCKNKRGCHCECHIVKKGWPLAKNYEDVLFEFLMALHGVRKMGGKLEGFYGMPYNGKYELRMVLSKPAKKAWPSMQKAQVSYYCRNCKYSNSIK